MRAVSIDSETCVTIDTMVVAAVAIYWTGSTVAPKASIESLSDKARAVTTAAATTVSKYSLQLIYKS